jgi:hypothetical protein
MIHAHELHPALRSLEARLGSAAAQRVDWALGLLDAARSIPEVGEMRAAFGSRWMFDAAGHYPQMARRWRERLGAWSSEGAELEGDPPIVVVALRDERGRSWSLRIGVEPAPPHRLLAWTVRRALPEGVRLREAASEEYAQLGEIELSCPLERADGALLFDDRRTCYADYLKLMGEVRVNVAEVDGRIVAVDPFAHHRARLGGVVRSLVHRHAVAILPEFQGLGLNDALAAYAGETLQLHSDAEAMTVYVDVDNFKTLQWWKGPRWHCRPFRASIPCAAVAAGGALRRATPGDASIVCGLLNACHEREQMFLPYDEARLRERLSRAASYGWPDLLLADRAVLGVWWAGEREIRELSDGRREERAVATAMDFGFAPGPGGLASFECLLRAACAWLAEIGVTHLAVASSDPSPGSAWLRSLASEVDSYVFGIRFDEPSETSEHGLYADAALL